MADRKASLLGLLETVAAGRADQFEEAVKAAYEAGASREDLLYTVEVGGSLGQVPLRPPGPGLRDRARLALDGGPPRRPPPRPGPQARLAPMLTGTRSRRGRATNRRLKLHRRVE